MIDYTLQGTGLELTEGIRAYVDDKLRDAFQSFGDMKVEAVSAAVQLEKTTRHHRKDERLFRAETNLSLPGHFIRAESSSDDLYRAIVEMKKTLQREILEWRRRIRDQYRSGARVATTPPEEAGGEELAAKEEG